MNTLWSTSCLGSIPITQGVEPIYQEDMPPYQEQEDGIPLKDASLPGSSVVTHSVTYLMRPDHCYSKEAHYLMGTGSLGISPMGISPSWIRLSCMSQHGGPCNQSYTTHILFYWSLLGCQVCYVRCEQTSIDLR